MGLRISLRRMAVAVTALLLGATGALVAALPAMANPTVSVVDADGGVYWRSAPDWNTPIQVAGQGVYTGDQVYLNCWVRGGTAPPYWNNPLWYNATVVAGRGRGTGLVNDHFLNTGTNQPNIILPGVPACGSTPPPPPPPATGTYINLPAPVHACPNQATGACQQILRTLPQYTPVSMVCWRKSSISTTEEYGTDMWFVVRNGDNEGWVHASHVIRQTTVPWCGDDITKNAEVNAASYWNQTYASSTVAGLFAGSDWAPGPYGEWSGDCVKLGYAAWHFAGRNPIARATAIKQYQAYASLGRIHTAGTPPMGALVFYTYSTVGHVNVSVGGGYVVTTNGIDGQGQANSYRTVGSYGSAYLGWAMP